MKTKIIDILNIIARGEQPPKKIIFRDVIYEYDEDDGDYYNHNFDALFDYHEITDILNEEVQILETTITIKPTYTFIDGKKYLVKYENGETLYEYIEDCNKIEKLNIALFDDNNLTIINKLKHIAFRVNEIIDKVNKDD